MAASQRRSFKEFALTDNGAFDTGRVEVCLGEARGAAMVDDEVTFVFHGIVLLRL
jgi:hypothetical protein